VKQVFLLTNVKGKEFPKKKITGNTRNAALREMLQTTAKVTKATFPVAKSRDRTTMGLQRRITDILNSRRNETQQSGRTGPDSTCRRKATLG